MRVLQVCQPTVEGVAVHVEMLASALPDRGVEVAVACPPGPLADHLLQRGVPWIAVPMVRHVDPAGDLRAVRSILRTLRRAEHDGRGFDLVHAHSAKAGAVARLAAAIARVPAVYTPHAWSFLAAGSRIERLVYRSVEIVLSFVTRRIVCVSEGERELGRQVGARSRCTVIPNGIEPPAEAFHDRRPQRDGSVVVGTIGRLAPQKGIDLLLEAAALVCARRPDVRFRIAGEGPSAHGLRVRARDLGIDDRVRFDGLVDGPWGVLRELDVFVLPSRWEGMPFTLLEAMSGGLPVVSFDVGGVRDLIVDERHGAVVEPGDVNGFAEAIVGYVDDPDERLRVGAGARERVLQRFTFDRMVDRNRELYLAATAAPADPGDALSTLPWRG